MVVLTKLTIPEKLRKEHKQEAKTDEETAEEEQEDPVLLVIHVNNVMQSIFPNIEVYITIQHIYNSNGLSTRKSYISNNFKGAISEYKGIFHCQGHDYVEFFDETMAIPLCEPSFTRTMEMLNRPDGFMLYGNLLVDFFSTSELLNPNMKNILQLIRARPGFTWLATTPMLVF